MDSVQEIGARPFWVDLGLAMRPLRHFWRFLGALIALQMLTTVFGSLAFAQAPTDTWRLGSALCTAAPAGYCTGGSATAATNTFLSAYMSTPIASGGGQGNGCSYSVTSTGSVTGYSTTTLTQVVNYAGSPGGCGTAAASPVHVCATGFTHNGTGTCVTTSSSCPTGGTAYTSGYYDMGTSATGVFPSYSVAPNGCGVTFSGACPTGSGMVAGVKHYYCKGEYSYVGGAPDTTSTLGTITATGSIPPNSCGSGQQGGYVNGAWVCLTTSGTGGNTTAATSGGQQTTTTQTTNGNGSVTTTNVTANPDGSQVVTTSTVSSTGLPMGTSTSDPLANKDDITKFCATKPNSPICKDQVDSVFSGACGGFTATGDAIQAAIAREIYQRNCQLYETNTASTLGQSVIDGTDGKLATATAKTTISMASAISQSTFLTAGTLADQSLTIQGQTVVIPWSNMNTYISMLGMLLVAVSLIVAARIATGG